MKLRTGVLALFTSAATLGAAIDLYQVYALPDYGFGSRGRHIQSWGRSLAASVGDVNLPSGVMQAAIWPEITNTGGGTLNLLPTPNPAGASTAASYARLSDGRYLVVGRFKDLAGMTRACYWVNSVGMPWVYELHALPMVANTTGAEALDVTPLPNGGAVVSGTDWFSNGGPVTWAAALWMVSQIGRAHV